MGRLDGSAILFDLDGTLVDTAGDLGASLNVGLEAVGMAPVPLSEVRHLVGHGAAAMLRKGFEVAGAASPAPSVFERARSVFLDHYRDNIAVHSAPFEGALEFMSDMRAAGAKLAICTNKSEALARRLISALDLTDQFVAIVGGDTASAPKPDGAPLRLAIEAARARRFVMVGDSDTDIRAANAVGAPCLLASFGYGPITLEAEAFASFDVYRMLAPMVEEALKGAA